MSGSFMLTFFSKNISELLCYSSWNFMERISLQSLLRSCIWKWSQWTQCRGIHTLLSHASLNICYNIFILLLFLLFIFLFLLEFFPLQSYESILFHYHLLANPPNEFLLVYTHCTVYTTSFEIFGKTSKNKNLEFRFILKIILNLKVSQRIRHC